MRLRGFGSWVCVGAEAKTYTCSGQHGAEKRPYKDHGRLKRSSHGCHVSLGQRRDVDKGLQHPFPRASLNDVCSPTRIEDLLLFGKDVEDFWVQLKP